MGPSIRTNWCDEGRPQSMDQEKYKCLNSGTSVSKTSIVKMYHSHLHHHRKCNKMACNQHVAVKFTLFAISWHHIWDSLEWSVPGTD